MRFEIQSSNSFTKKLPICTWSRLSWSCKDPTRLWQPFIARRSYGGRGLGYGLTILTSGHGLVTSASTSGSLVLIKDDNTFAIGWSSRYTAQPMSSRRCPQNCSWGSRRYWRFGWRWWRIGGRRGCACKICKWASWFDDNIWRKTDHYENRAGCYIACWNEAVVK